MIILLLFAAALGAAAQTQSSGGRAWMAIGDSARVTTSQEHGMTLDYDVAPKKFSLAALPLGDGSLDGMKALRFRIKTSASGPIGVALNEREPGGHYSAWFWSVADRWQEVVLLPSDFALNDNPTDPKDPDGRLDLDQVALVSVIDLAQFFNILAENKNLPIAIDTASGHRSIAIQKFEILTEAPHQDGRDVAGDVTTWATLGGAELSAAKASNPLGKPAMQASYQQVDSNFPVLIRRFPGKAFAAATGVEFDVASERDANVIVAVEEYNPSGGQGPRYNLTVEVPSGKHASHQKLAFADFQPDENNASGSPGRLTPERIKSIGLVDITAVMGGNADHNTLWVTGLRAAR